MWIDTERLVLRPWRHDEAEQLLAIMSREDVMRWLGDEPPEGGAVFVLTDVTEAHARVDRWAAVEEPRGYWAVVPRDGSGPVGSVLLMTLPNAADDEVEIGWWLHPDAQGRGLATEAARAVLDHALAAGLTEVVAVVHPGNDASTNVCRKLGMQHEGVVETPWYAGPLELFRVRAPGAQPGSFTG